MNEGVIRNNPRVINEFEGGPLWLFWENSMLFGMDYKSDYMKPIVLAACKEHPIFKELKITPVIEAVKYIKEPLVKECEECEDCRKETCPKDETEVYEKGAGLKIAEVLEGWVIEFAECIPWRKCPCCDGEGYLKHLYKDGKPLKQGGQR